MNIAHTKACVKQNFAVNFTSRNYLDDKICRIWEFHSAISIHFQFIVCINNSREDVQESKEALVDLCWTEMNFSSCLYQYRNWVRRSSKRDCLGYQVTLWSTKISSHHETDTKTNRPIEKLMILATAERKIVMLETTWYYEQLVRPYRYFYQTKRFGSHCQSNSRTYKFPYGAGWSRQLSLLPKMAIGCCQRSQYNI